MAYTLSLYSFMSVKLDGRPIEAGSLQIPATLQIESVHDQVVSVGTSTTVDIFDVADDLADFDFLWVQTDFDLMLELVTDSNASIGRMPYTVGLKGSGVANQYGPPFLLARDDSYANYTITFGGGTLDLIERITVRNLSATQAARCLVIAAT